MKRVDGFSVSLWKSVAVKSIRMGWPNGWRRAQLALGQTVDWHDYLIAGVFEDLWPSRDQLSAVLAEVNGKSPNLTKLFARDPHHGQRQLSDTYADMAAHVEPRIFAQEGMARAYASQAYELGLGHLGKRSLSEFAIWWEADPPPAPGLRVLDKTKWAGMPPAMADLHTMEGRRAGTMITLLCGHPDGHRGLMGKVAQIGWEGVRASVHAEQVFPGELRQGALFEE